MRIYVDAPESYRMREDNVVVVGVSNLTGQPIRSLDFAGCRRWHIEPSGKWVAVGAGHPLPTSEPADADLQANLSTVVLEIASTTFLNTERPASINVSRGIGNVVIDPYRDHLYRIDAGDLLSRPGEYQLKAVLTKNGKVVYESPIRTLRIEAPDQAATEPGRP